MKHVGISSIATYIPTNKYSTHNLVKKGFMQERVYNKIGVKEVPIGEEQETPTEMAIKAGRKLLLQENVDFQEINLLVYVGATPPDFLLWSAAAKITHELNLKNCFSFEIQLGCGGLQAAFQAIKAMMLSNDKWTKALVVTADKWGPYTKERSGAGLIFGDSAAAALLEKGNNVLNRFICFHGHTDGQFHSLGHLSSGTTYTKRLMNQYPDLVENQYSIIDGSTIPLLNEVNVANYKKVATQVLSDSKWELEDVSCIILPSGRRDLMERIIQELSLSVEKTNMPFLAQQGDLGAPGLLVDLENILNCHNLKKGDKILILSAGVGITWMALTLQV
ncbi:3-oxoacyl-ACP synthase III family protein [Priestia koreensis]|uniref:3-oxoacyl-ACP synthase III family protein n=1 Tax=Priestia koreensis TaxID=284581 RepID=UPI001F591795|nr:3-oxoacyl-[acyl-carrier-protein] synthase III C-terminal domain-containing protein [Priestia koreensis]UNL86800.1 hypothetical protein IE339_10040 [Priestia koreensis]